MISPSSVRRSVGSLFHMAVRNSRVHEFFPESLVSQPRIELQRVRLSIQQEIVDVSQIRAGFNGGDQQLADTKASIRAAHGHAANFGRPAIIPQQNTRGSHGAAVNQCNEMKGFAIILIALQFHWNALFDDKDLFSNPKTLLYVP